MTSSIDIHDVVAKEIACCDELLQVIQVERTALESSQTDAIANIVLEKQDIMAQMESLAALHFEYMQEQGYAPTLEGVQAFIDSIEDPSLQQSLRQLLEKLASCERENQINGQIISIQSKHADNLLDVILGRDANEKVYNQDGSLT